MTAEGLGDDQLDLGASGPSEQVVDQSLMDRLARLLALQALYEVDLTGHDADEAVSNAVSNHEHNEMIVALFGEQDKVPDAVVANAKMLVGGVLARLDAIDPVIESAAPARTIGEQAAIERNILRLASYQLLFEPEVPAGALINDAVELAKGFAGENSGKFINGVLGTIFRQVQRRRNRKHPGVASPSDSRTTGD